VEKHHGDPTVGPHLKGLNTEVWHAEETQMRDNSEGELDPTRVPASAARKIIRPFYPD